MKFFRNRGFLALLAALVGTGIVPQVLFAQRASSEEFEARLNQSLRPVEAQVRFGMNRSTVSLLRTDPIGLVSQAPGDGELMTPFNALRGFYSVRVNSDMRQLYQFAEEGQREAVLANLRREFYPLIPFIPIPEANTNLHSFLGVAIELLLRIGEVEEALWLHQKLPVSIQAEKLAATTDRLFDMLVEKEYLSDAADLAVRIPLDALNPDDLEKRLERANLLRTAGNEESARLLYSQVAEVGGPISVSAQLWLLYLDVANDRFAEAARKLKLIDLPDEETSDFSLYHLVLGRLALGDGNAMGALVHFGNALVNGALSATSRPEILYYARQTYLELQNTEAADAISLELTVLYPDSVWTNRL
ncbi:MAG: hypothetical protein ACFCU4_10780 [Puniceicoccaceae bacterium]